MASNRIVYCGYLRARLPYQGSRQATLGVSAASRRSRGVEHELHSQILMGRAHGLEPAAAGAVMLHYAKDPIRLSDDASSNLDERCSGMRNFMRVSASNSVLVQRLGSDLDRLRTEKPNVKVHLAKRASVAVIETGASSTRGKNSAVLGRGARLRAGLLGDRL